MNPALTEKLAAVAAHAATLGHGEKAGYLKSQAAELGISVATLYRKLEAVSVKPGRKRRSDAGRSELSLHEAQLISAVLMEAMRRNGKRLMSVARAVEMLRANGKIDAARVDEETGEVLPLSESTVTRALREYKLHPDQLLQPAPVNRMKSEHPNHCWQIDPSLCVLYYLPRSGEDSGLRVMKQEEFYKNKPKNVVKIENDRVWRYTGTDHASGTILARYYFGGETSANLCDFFIFMMQEKQDVLKDPFAARAQADHRQPVGLDIVQSRHGYAHRVFGRVHCRNRAELQGGGKVMGSHFWLPVFWVELRQPAAAAHPARIRPS